MTETESVIEPPKTRFFFNRENAKHYSALANQVRWSQAKEKKLANEDKEQQQAIPEDGFIIETLLCVRERIKTALKDMAKETDAGKLDKLASTISRLEVVEQKLSGRASPGSLRPKADKPRRSSGAIEPEV